MKVLPSAPTLTRRMVLGGAAAAVLPLECVHAAGLATLRVTFPAPAATLDPAKFRTGGIEYNYGNCVFNRLTRLDPALQVLPDLATTWEATPDLKEWTFHLRPGVAFHDGAPLSAADVVFTFQRLQDRANGSVLRANLTIVSAIEAIDPLTVRFRLAVAYADLPALVAGYQAMIINAAGAAALATKPIGTGPFRFVEYRPGDQIVVERNPSYFLPGLPKADRVILRVVPEFTTAVAALESGAVDIVYDLPPEQVDHLARSQTATVSEIASGAWQGIVMNNQTKPFDDPRVREAFIKLVDKPSFTDIASFGHGTPTVTPLPPTHPYYRRDIPLGADIPGAKRLLAEAGLANGFQVEMVVPGASPPTERLATAFREAAKQAGIDVQLRTAPPDKFFAEMEGKVGFCVDYFYGRTTPDLMLYGWYHSTGAYNTTLWHYNNPAVDRLLDAARATTDKDEQKRLYGEFQEIVAKDGPGCVVYVQNFACGLSKAVQGFAPSPLKLVDVTAVTLGS